MNQRKKNTLFTPITDFFNKYSREYYVFVFFTFFLLSIIFKTFSYTVSNKDFYTALANKQQMGEVELPVSRGNIYFADGKSLMATSVNLNDLSIDPSIEGNKLKLSVFLTDVVYKEVCYEVSEQICYENIKRYLKVLELDEFIFDEDYIKDLITADILEKVNREFVTSVLLKESLTETEQKLIVNEKMAGVYAGNNMNLYVNPEEIQDDDVVATKLQSIVGGDFTAIKNSLRKRKVQYQPIIKKLGILNYEEVLDFIRNEQEALKLGTLDSEDAIYKFLILEPHADRFYPEKKLGSQIVGFLDNKLSGHYGIEGFYDNILSGTSGKTITIRDSRGRPIDPFSLSLDDVIKGGSDIETTIDRSVQKNMEQIIEDGVKEYGANKGTIVVMNPQNGEVISMANYPSFDPNNPGEVYEIEKIAPTKYANPYVSLLGKTVLVEDSEVGDEFIYDKEKIKLRDATREELRDLALQKYIYKNDFGASVYQNDAVSSLYEPGSIMKAVTVAVGIDSEEISKNEFYQDNMKVQIDQFTIANIAGQCAGYNTFTNALSWSCNVGMVRIVQRVGKALLYNYFRNFGFGDETGISLDGEISGKIEEYQQWSRAKLFTASYGLGVSVTPLQMATAYSVIANGGVYIKPSIVKTVTFPDGRVLESQPEKVRRVISEKTSKIVTSMLVEGVDSGAAAKGQVPGYAVAGKTGTAQIPYRGIYETGVGSTNASFAGYGPAEDPQFVILVKLERPRTNEYGGQTSAVIFSKAAGYLFDYYGIPKKLIEE